MNFLRTVTVVVLLAVGVAAQQSQQVTTFVRFEDAKTTVPVDAAITADMLRVTENGRPVRSVDMLSKASELPARYLVLFDDSGSGQHSPNVHAVRMAVPDLLAKLVRREKDSVALVNFNDEFYLDVPLSDDIEQFSKKLRETEDYRGGTAMVDAIVAVSNYTGRRSATPERRVMLLFSDGEDNASHKNLRDAVAAAIANHVEIYALSVAGSPGASRGTPILRQLTETTGGRLFENVKPRQSEDFLGVLQRVLDSEYVLTYTPADMFQKNLSRSLQITTTLPNITAVGPRFVQ